MGGGFDLVRFGVPRKPEETVAEYCPEGGAIELGIEGGIARTRE
jgi:hypothetical protein